MRYILNALALLVVSFTLTACDDGINKSIVDKSRGVLLVLSERDPEKTTKTNAMGTGFFIAENVILTNNHVIEDAKSIKVGLEHSKVPYDVEVINSDPVSDVAVLRIKDWDRFKGENDYVILKLAEPESARLTETVYTIGHPWGLSWTISRGIVSALDRKPGMSPKVLIQVDARVYQGNSGGPLFNEDGEVIGINSLMVSGEGGSFGFALPVEVVEKVLRDFEKHGEARWAYIGVKLNEEIIEEVSPGLPADVAGLKKDDVILEYTTSLRTYDPREKNPAVAMSSHDSDEPVTFVVMRAGKRVEVMIQPKWRDAAAIKAMDNPMMK